MSEESKPAAEKPVADDRFKNLQSEMDRKLGNVTAELKSSIEGLAAMLKPKAAPAPTENLSDLIYSDPQAFANRVIEQASSVVSSQVTKAANDQAKQNQVLAQLTSKYPELRQDDHELTLASIKEYGGLSAEMKALPDAYELAVSRAASDLGIKPKSKRSSDDDSFALNGSGSGSPRRQKGNSEIDPRTEQFAKLMGVDPTKVKERAKNRKNIGSWE